MSVLQKAIRLLARPGLWLGLLAAYWTALFIATHIPGDSAPDVGRVDKALHFVAFGGLAVLATIALAMRVGALSISALVAVVLALAIYGGVDELLQALVGRSCNIYDWIADVAGAAAGALFFALTINRFMDKPQSIASAP